MNLPAKAQLKVKSKVKVRVKAADRVLLACSIRHQDQILEQFTEREPLEVQLGKNNLPLPIEMMLIGEAQGGALTISVSAADEIYGTFDAQRVHDIALARFAHPPEAGELIDFGTPEQETLPGLIKQVRGDLVTVDFNHPYAGRDLTFEIKILKIL